MAFPSYLWPADEALREIFFASQVASHMYDGSMRFTLIPLLLLAVLSSAAEPTTKPTVPQKVHGSAVGPAPELELLGPVRIANYTRPFGTPKPDPHQYYRDRHTYSTPPCWYGYGYYGYWGYYGCGYYRGCYGFGFNPYTTPTSIFYGD
jgi:hypothetical protein